MTKEEFKELFSLRDREYLENLLYDIYFNRTCENCKFSKLSKKISHIKTYKCSQLVREDCNREENMHDFGCILWDNK